MFGASAISTISTSPTGDLHDRGVAGCFQDGAHEQGRRAAGHMPNKGEAPWTAAKAHCGERFGTDVIRELASLLSWFLSSVHSASMRSRE